MLAVGARSRWPAYRVGNSDLRPAVPTCRFAQRDEVRTCLLVATVRGSSLCVGRVRSTSSSPSTSRTDRTHESREVVRCERQVRAGAHRSARPARTHARCCFSPARSGDWRPLKRPRSPCQTSRRNDRSRQGREGVRPSPSRSHRGSQQPRGHTCRWPTRRGDRAHEGATWDRCVHGPGGQHRGARGPACGPMSTTLDAGLRPMITLPTSNAARLAPPDGLDQSLATTARPASRDDARRTHSGRTPTLLPRTDRANEPTPPALARNAHPIPAYG